LPDFHEKGNLTKIFEKYQIIKFQENPPSGSRVVPCGQQA
jgi:hypothetical protein